MSKTYDGMTHTHCMIDGDATMYPREIVLVVGGGGGVKPDRVWVPGSYADRDHLSGAEQIKDTHSMGFDEDGNCLWSVPFDACKFYTEEEAENICRCIDTDQQLLSYAIG